MTLFNNIDDDIEYVEKIRNKDRVAFRIVMEDLAPRIRSYIRGLGADEELCDDVVQMTFTKLWVKAHMWDPKYRLATWMFTIARNELFSVYRKTNKINDIDITEIEVEDTSDTPDEVYVKKENANMVMGAMKMLSDRHREALLLRYSQEKSQKQSAAIMGLGEKAFESLLSRAKAKLKQILEADYD